MDYFATFLAAAVTDSADVVDLVRDERLIVHYRTAPHSMMFFVMMIFFEARNATDTMDLDGASHV